MHVLLLLLAFLVPIPSSRAQDGYPTLAPFEAVRWPGGEPEALVDGTWYRLLAIDGVPSEDIAAFCEKRWPGQVPKRFSEDLVEAMTRMGHPPGSTVDLRIAGGSSGQTRVLSGVSMTGRKRQAALAFNNGGGAPVPAGSPATAPMRVEREHDPAAGERYPSLASGLDMDELPGGSWLSGDEAREDLDELEWDLVHGFSYLDLTGVDHEAAFDAVRAGIGERITVADFSLRLRRLLGLFGDGHTRIDTSLGRSLPRGYATWLVDRVGEGLVAFRGDRSALLDPEHPYLMSLDGLPVDAWLAVAGGIEAQGSPQWVRRNAVRNLRFVNWIRRELGLEERSRVTLGLASEGGRVRELELEVGGRRAIYGEWPRREHGRLEGDIGYLRLASMESDPDFLAGLRDAMKGFRDTRGLVIDVRGNSGGSRAALRTLLPYFLDPEVGPQVVNLARYRLRTGEQADAPEGHLSNRYLFPLPSSRWQESERRAIEEHVRGFEPEWSPARGAFSDWHFMLVAPQGTEVYHYDRPVTVLTNADCFSATDVFLGAFAGREGITLVGEASGGGSGRSTGYRLAHSGIELRASTMASYRPTGEMYDGRGVAPDVEVDASAGYYIGSEDPVLARALELLAAPVEGEGRRSGKGSAAPRRAGRDRGERRPGSSSSGSGTRGSGAYCPSSPSSGRSLFSRFRAARAASRTLACGSRISGIRLGRASRAPKLARPRIASTRISTSDPSSRPISSPTIASRLRRPIWRAAQRFFASW